jgi:hypothetical protein
MVRKTPPPTKPEAPTLKPRKSRPRALTNKLIADAAAMIAGPQPKTTQGGRAVGSRNRYSKDIKIMAMRYGKMALKEIVALCKHIDPKIRLAASKEILDRAYGRPVQPQSGPSGTGPIEIQVTWLPMTLAAKPKTIDNSTGELIAGD